MRVSVLAAILFSNLGYAQMPMVSPSVRGECSYATEEVRRDIDNIKEQFQESDVSVDVSALRAIVQRCHINLNNYGLGAGFPDYWERESYKAMYNKAKDQVDWNSKFGTDAQNIEQYKKYASKLGYKKTDIESYASANMQEGNRAEQSEKSKCAPSVDLRGPKLGPVRNQDGVGWCYAFAASDLLSYKLGKTVSAMGIALAYNDGWISYIRKAVFKSSEANIEGGSADSAINTAMSHGLCLENQLKSEDNGAGELMYNIVRVESLKSSSSKPTEICNWCEDNLIKPMFPSLGLKDLTGVLKNSSRATLIQNFSDKACQPKIKVNYKVKSTFMAHDKRQLFDTIDDQLNKKNIIAISYDADVLTEANFTRGMVDHQSVIVGRRFNEHSHACEYLIRNSWGRSCGYYYSGFSCEEGNIWVPKNALSRGIGDVTYVE